MVFIVKMSKSKEFKQSLVFEDLSLVVQSLKVSFIVSLVIRFEAKEALSLMSFWVWSFLKSVSLLLVAHTIAVVEALDY